MAIAISASSLERSTQPYRALPGHRIDQYGLLAAAGAPLPRPEGAVFGHHRAVLHVTAEVLLAGLDQIRRAPADGGRVEMIVRRPAQDEREVLSECVLDRVEGLVGDNWHIRPSSRTADRSPHPDKQLTLMNARCAALVAGAPEQWPLAGDQLYIDLDLGTDNLPPGTRLACGSAVIEITDQPHRGCAKFAQRFGGDALRFVNSAEGRKLNLRGVNARVVVSGRVCVGDVARKVGAE